MQTSGNPDQIDDRSIRERIHELESEIGNLRTNLDARKGYTRFSRAFRWKAILFLLAVLFFSILPPLLVTLDRWFHVVAVSDMPRDLFCKIDFMCRIYIP